MVLNKIYFTFLSNLLLVQLYNFDAYQQQVVGSSVEPSTLPIRDLAAQQPRQLQFQLHLSHQQQRNRQETNQELNVTQLLFHRFQYLFKDVPDTVKQLYEPNVNVSAFYPRNIGEQDEQSSLLETRADGDSNSLGEQQKSDNIRSFFRIVNRVFSRVDLPQVYRSSSRKASNCALHIGCVEEIPNFPSLLKKANISSSFTIYTRNLPKNGLKVLYEPLVHHQLRDGNISESELEEKLKLVSNSISSVAQLAAGRLVSNYLGSRRPIVHQVATSLPSWRSVAKIIRSQEYPFDLSALEQSGFNASLNTRIIIGGYFAKEDEEWIDEVVRQWLLLEPSNIIKVSWADANRGLYHTAAYNSRIVGRQLSLFLYYLNQMFSIDLNRFHLVGHSLGAHIAGFVGADSEGKIARITGLDPAGPIFVELNASMRLDPTDAQFVDVVHTNGGTITKGALGLSTPSGHVDYYCNGGNLQPGCYFSSVTKSIMDPVERVACSHRRSYRYFIEIIKLAIGEQSVSTADPPSSESTPSTSFRSITQFPRAFLFEAKHEELVKLTQPEIVLMTQQANSVTRREFNGLDLAPLKHRLEFHLLKPEFPPNKRGMYFFKTRSEAPYFASKQYALTIKTDTIVRRKIALIAKIDQTVVAEAELDEIPGIYTLAFAPNDPRTIEMADDKRAPQLSLMWKHRSFNLLLSQQNELHLKGLELSLLDSDSDQHPIIKYTISSSQTTSNIRQVVASTPPTSTSNSPSVGDFSLARNQWYKFEGRWERPPVISL